MRIGRSGISRCRVHGLCGVVCRPSRVAGMSENGKVRQLKQQNQSARLQALWRLATSRSRSDEEKADLMLHLARDVLGVDTAFISEATGGKFIVRYLVDGLGFLRVGEACPLEALCKAAIQGERSTFVYHMQSEKRFQNRPEISASGLQVYAGIPIWVGEALFGTLVFLRKQPLVNEVFSPDDKTFMDLLANWFGLMLLRSKQHEALQTLALTDSLTGLPNRRAAELRFSEEISRAQRGGGGNFSIAICDLDRFKLINDHFGHGVGDEVLRQSARIMRQALRDGDWMARWGGEEFLIFLHQSDAGDARSAVERIRETLKAQMILTSEGDVNITASFGIGVYQGEGEISSVLSEADGCLYEAKKHGRDRVVLAASIGQTTLWRAGMLQRALHEGRVVSAYQTMVDLRTGVPVADEALARLRRPDGALIPAAEFIEAAEGVNLIHEVDRAITLQAMSRCATSLKASGNPNFAHFINLSPQFLARRDLVDELMNNARNHCGSCKLDDRQVKPLVFEITERQLLSDFERMRQDIQPLLDFGFRLALDDFGSGYSSFLYLAELPISFLKIEGWMVQNMHSNKRVRYMVESVVALARRLEVVTIAEFVEDKETADVLREMGVDWGQGYYFGRPEM